MEKESRDSWSDMAPPGLDKVEELKDAIREKFGDEAEFEYFEIGSVVGSHSGPGLLGVIYVNPYISDRF